jgi:hypothetical protein
LLTGRLAVTCGKRRQAGPCASHEPGWIDSVGVFLYITIVKRTPPIVLVIAVILFFLLPMHRWAIPAEAAIREEKFLRFEEAVSLVARQYIGTPFGFGKSAVESGAVDNSHLFHLIYSEAAQMAGMHYLGYAPMDRLLERTFQISRRDIRAGDLIVLKDGLAAMIYRIESPNLFHMIYVSEKRREVISFNSGNVVYEVYWLEHLRGFFRLTPFNFTP